MRSCVLESLNLIPSAGDDVGSEYYDRPDRDLFGRPRFSRLTERFPHEISVARKIQHTEGKFHHKDTKHTKIAIHHREHGGQEKKIILNSGLSGLCASMVISNLRALCAFASLREIFPLLVAPLRPPVKEFPSLWLRSRRFVVFVTLCEN